MYSRHAERLSRLWRGSACLASGEEASVCVAAGFIEEIPPRLWRDTHSVQSRSLSGELDWDISQSPHIDK